MEKLVFVQRENSQYISLEIKLVKHTYTHTHIFKFSLTHIHLNTHFHSHTYLHTLIKQWIDILNSENDNGCKIARSSCICYKPGRI